MSWGLTRAPGYGHDFGQVLLSYEAQVEIGTPSEHRLALATGASYELPLWSGRLLSNH